jgi:hypothetical protein
VLRPRGRRRIWTDDRCNPTANGRNVSWTSARWSASEMWSRSPGFVRFVSLAPHLRSSCTLVAENGFCIWFAFRLQHTQINVIIPPGLVVFCVFFQTEWEMLSITWLDIRSSRMFSNWCSSLNGKIMDFHRANLTCKGSARNEVLLRGIVTNHNFTDIDQFLLPVYKWY